MKRLIAMAVLLIMTPALAPAQDADHQYRAQGYVFFAPDATKSSAVATRPFEYNATKGVAVSYGFGAEAFVYKGLGLGAEAGYAGLDWSFGRNGIGVGSADVSYHFLPKTNNGKRSKLEPFVAGGYTLFAGQDTGSGSIANGFNLGGGINIWLRKRTALRLEVRENAHGGAILRGNFPNLTEFNFFAFRIGLTFR